MTAEPKVEPTELECKKCGHVWDYKPRQEKQKYNPGKPRMFTICPWCHTSVKIADAMRKDSA